MLLFIYKTSNSFEAALIYEDGVIIIGDDSKKNKGKNTFLDEKFSFKAFGALQYFLGIKVARIREDSFSAKYMMCNDLKILPKMTLVFLLLEGLFMQNVLAL